MTLPLPTLLHLRKTQDQVVRRLVTDDALHYSSVDMSINQSVNQRFLRWPKWYATDRTTTGNKTVGTEMSYVCDGMLSEFRPR